MVPAQIRKTASLNGKKHILLHDICTGAGCQLFAQGNTAVLCNDLRTGHAAICSRKNC